jgi:hypothetical protein
VEEKHISPIFFQWSAPTRYFEKKPDYYFKAIISLGVLLSLLLFFLAEYVLIFVVWTCVLVLYLRASVAPLDTIYKLTKFGVQFYDTNIDYKAIRAFTVDKKKETHIARFFLFPHGEVHLVLPHNNYKEIIHYLQEKVPFIEVVPESDAERIGKWLKKLVGLH